MKRLNLSDTIFNIFVGLLYHRHVIAGQRYILMGGIRLTW